MMKADNEKDGMTDAWEVEIQEKRTLKMGLLKKCLFAAAAILMIVIFVNLFVKGLSYGLKHVDVEEEADVEAEADGDYKGMSDAVYDGRPEDIGREHIPKEADSKEEILKQKAEIKELNLKAMENRKGEFVFAASMDDFIDSYNGYYWKDKGTRYLLPSWEWRSYRYDYAVHSRYETGCYHFSGDETISPYPTITVYAPTNADYIQEITVNFDDHSYTDQLYKVYEEMCFYTIKVCFPDMPDEQIIKLYTTLNKLAFDHITPVKYTSESVPCALYYRGDIGLYPYFAYGECVHLCVIPVTPQYVEEMRNKGVEIVEI